MINVVPPYYYVRNMAKKLIHYFDIQEILKCTAWKEENILYIAHDQEIVASDAYEKEIILRISNGKEVFRNIADEQGVGMSYLMERSHL
jgi:hypothetical protein